MSALPVVEDPPAIVFSISADFPGNLSKPSRAGPGAKSRGANEHTTLQYVRVADF